MDYNRKNKNVLLIDPQDNFDSCLSFLHEKFKGIETLFVIDDCANEDAMMHKTKSIIKNSYERSTFESFNLGINSII